MHPKIKWKGKERDMLEFAKTPPKGWNSWDVYGASVTEEEVKRNADIMAEKLKKYGWNYVVVDIQWYEPGAESAAYRKFADLKIDEYSRVLPAENRFPSSADGVGFAPLAEYVHQLGLKFGIHILRGTSGCEEVWKRKDYDVWMDDYLCQLCDTFTIYRKYNSTDNHSCYAWRGILLPTCSVFCNGK